MTRKLTERETKIAGILIHTAEVLRCAAEELMKHHNADAPDELDPLIARAIKNACATHRTFKAILEKLDVIERPN